VRKERQVAAPRVRAQGRAGAGPRARGTTAGSVPDATAAGQHPRPDQIDLAIRRIEWRAQRQAAMIQQQLDRQFAEAFAKAFLP
jgi:hypothetical protein